MKKALIAILFAGVVAFIFFSMRHDQKTMSPEKSPSPTPSIIPATISDTILFVPYWSLSGGIDNHYNEYVYFGITPDKIGISHGESGYTDIPLFLKQVPPQAKKLLGVQMTSSVTNEFVLQKDDVQQKIINDAVDIAKTNGFDGIVLDLEYSAFPFDSVIQSVSIFSKRFADGAKSHNLLFYQTIYGDTYYRGRPYVVKDLVKNADKILVMAYDFHKANGDPGANFPFEAGNDGYSFQEMVNNFVKEVPSSKLTIVFGMFGYDWTLDEKGNSVGQAESLSDNEILQKFLEKCQFKNCSTVQNSALETRVEYQDASGQKHEVWFEDKNSITKKEAFLQTNGVSSVGFWANGYF